MKAASAPHSAPQLHAIDDDECRLFREAAELAGRKWTAAILLSLARGAERFSEIHASIDGISDRLLAARLRELEAQGLVTRTVVPSTPVQIRYGLTPSGSELITILQPLVHWARRSGARSDAGEGPLAR
ncbi:MAG: winged helix-turn-helix transcriptional regulator [Leucobacter sp.]